MKPRAPLALQDRQGYKERQGQKGIGVLKGCQGLKGKMANRD